jgi:flagellar biosynthesis/type III secretory pathway protein FliH
MRSKSSHFALWTVEEQVAAGKMAEDSDELANSEGDIDALGLTSDAGHVNSEDDTNTSLSGLDAEALEKIKKEAYDRGVADGKKLQQETLIEEAEQTQAESLTALADRANQLLISIEQGVVALQENPASWNEPLKRLALHLAEQLTLTELSISASGIQNMIDRCIETLDVQSASSVVVELNPTDMALLQAHKAAPGEKTHPWRLVADTHLLPGSVRVRADDAVVSDLIEHRLETLAQALLQDTKPWQAQTAFQPERLAARRGKAQTVEDALPRDVTPLDISALDLPDLNLSDAKPLSEDDESGVSNV